MYPNSGFNNNGATPYSKPTLGFGKATSGAVNSFMNKPATPPPPVHAGLLAPTAPPTSHTVTTAPDGTTTTKQTYQQPAQDANPSQSSTPTPQSQTTPTPQNPTPQTQPGMINSTPQVGTPTQNAQNVLNQSAPTALATGAGEANALYGMLSNERQLQPFAGGQTQGLDQSYANLTRPQSTGNLAGETGLFDVQRGILQNAAQSTASNALAQQGLATQGATTVADASLYSPTSYGQTNTSGLTGVADAGQFGSGPGAAANVQSVQDNQSKINAIASAAPAADAAFSVLNSYAQGIGGNIPITQGLSQLYGSTAQGSQAVAGFKAQLQAVRDAWGTIEGGDATSAVPDNVTPAQLTQIQQQLKTDAQNKTTGYRNEINQLSNQGSSGGSTGGNMFGSFFSKNG